MKKYFIALLMAVAGFMQAYACDICGCGVGNYNPFLFPHLSKSYLSLSYMHRAYKTYTDEGTGKEYYNTLLLTGQYSLGQRIRLMAVLPFQFNRLSSGDDHVKTNGLGDLSLLINYKVLDRVTNGIQHSILAGAGVKFSTGKYSVAKTDESSDQNFQLGTGSIDYIFNSSYRVTYRQWNFSLAGSYKYNTANKYNYRFGDLFNYGATIAYRKDLDQLSVSPYLQAIQEVQMKDADNHVLRENSGGHILYAGAGLDVNTIKMAVGFNYQFTANQNLAEGSILAKPRYTLRLSFII